MADRTLSALSTAWTTTTISIMLFVVVLELSRVWDTAIYFRALQVSLVRNI
jgi:hypothetical protein